MAFICLVSNRTTLIIVAAIAKSKLFKKYPQPQAPVKKGIAVNFILSLQLIYSAPYNKAHKGTVNCPFACGYADLRNSASLALITSCSAGVAQYGRLTLPSASRLAFSSAWRSLFDLLIKSPCLRMKIIIHQSKINIKRWPRGYSGKLATAY